MNFAKLSFLLLLILSITACGDDDEDAMMICMQSDWIGTYTGTEVCGSSIADVTVSITASGTDAVVIELLSPGFDPIIYDPVVPTGCSISVFGPDQIVSRSFTASLDNDVVTVSSTITTDTPNEEPVSSTCVATATRD